MALTIEKIEAIKGAAEQGAEQVKAVLESNDQNEAITRQEAIDNAKEAIIYLQKSQMENLKDGSKEAVIEASRQILQAEIENISAAIQKEQTGASANSKLRELQENKDALVKARDEAVKLETELADLSTRTGLEKRAKTEIREVSSDLKMAWKEKDFTKLGLYAVSAVGIAAAAKWLYENTLGRLIGSKEKPGFFKKALSFIATAAGAVLGAVGLKTFSREGISGDNPLWNLVPAFLQPPAKVAGGASGHFVKKAGEVFEVVSEAVLGVTEIIAAISTGDYKSATNALKDRGFAFVEKGGTFVIETVAETVTVPYEFAQQYYNYVTSGEADGDLMILFGEAGAAYVIGHTTLRSIMNGRLVVPSLGVAVGRIGAWPLMIGRDTIVNAHLVASKEGQRILKVMGKRAPIIRNIARRSAIKNARSGSLTKLQSTMKYWGDNQEMLLTMERNMETLTRGRFTVGQLENLRADSSRVLTEIRSALKNMTIGNDTSETLKALVFVAKGNPRTEEFAEAVGKYMAKVQDASSVLDGAISSPHLLDLIAKGSPIDEIINAAGGTASDAKLAGHSMNEIMNELASHPRKLDHLKSLLILDDADDLLKAGAKLEDVCSAISRMDDLAKAHHLEVLLQLEIKGGAKAIDAVDRLIGAGAKADDLVAAIKSANSVSTTVLFTSDVVDHTNKLAASAANAADVVTSEKALDSLLRSSSWKKVLKNAGLTTDEARAFLKLSEADGVLKLDPDTIAMIARDAKAKDIVVGAIKSGSTDEMLAALNSARNARALSATLNVVGGVADVFGIYMAYCDWEANKERIKSTKNPALQALYAQANVVYGIEAGTSAAGLSIGGIAFISAKIGGESVVSALSTTAANVMAPVGIAVLAGRWAYNNMEAATEELLADHKFWMQKRPAELLMKLRENAPGKYVTWYESMQTGASHSYYEDSRTPRYEYYANKLSMDEKEFTEWEQQNYETREIGHKSKREEITIAYVIRTTMLQQQAEESQDQYNIRFKEHVADQLNYISAVSKGEFDVSLLSIYKMARSHADLAARSREIRKQRASRASQSSDFITVKDGKTYDLAEYELASFNTPNSEGVRKQTVLFQEFSQREKQQIDRLNFMGKINFARITDSAARTAFMATMGIGSIEDTTPEAVQKQIQQKLVLDTTDELLLFDGKTLRENLPGLELFGAEAESRSLVRYTANWLYRTKLKEVSASLYTKLKSDGLSPADFGSAKATLLSPFEKTPQQLYTFGIDNGLGKYALKKEYKEAVELLNAPAMLTGYVAEKTRLQDIPVEIQSRVPERPSERAEAYDVFIDTAQKMFIELRDENITYAQYLHLLEYGKLLKTFPEFDADYRVRNFLKVIPTEGWNRHIPPENVIKYAYALWPVIGRNVADALRLRGSFVGNTIPDAPNEFPDFEQVFSGQTRSLRFKEPRYRPTTTGRPGDVEHTDAKTVSRIHVVIDSKDVAYDAKEGMSWRTSSGLLSYEQGEWAFTPYDSDLSTESRVYVYHDARVGTQYVPQPGKWFEVKKSVTEVDDVIANQRFVIPFPRFTIKIDIYDGQGNAQTIEASPQDKKIQKYFSSMDYKRDFETWAMSIKPGMGVQQMRFESYNPADVRYVKRVEIEEKQEKMRDAV
ncbi:MAG: hypothetical protein O2904_04605 [bacterium]|nr:hypothetical protein [bacterium]